MSIPVVITNGLKSQVASIYNPTKDNREGEAGLTVYIDERKLKSFEPVPIFNSVFGIALNQNGAFGGTPDGIHDGIDSVLWTGSNITGTKATFNSTTRFFAGAQSVEVDNSSSGDIFQFDKGSNLTVSNYTALTLKVNIDKDWDSGDSISIYGYDTGGAVQVGNKILLENYLSIVDFDVWQSVTIPLVELGLTAGTVDAFRVEQEVKNGKAPLYYIDNFQVEETGNQICFRYQPLTNEIFHVTRVAIFVVRDATTSLQIQAYDKYFGDAALGNGTVVNIQSRGETVVTGNQQTIESFLTLPQSQIIVGGDNVNSWMKISNDIQFDLVGTDQDFVEWRVQDNLTGLAVYNVWVFGWNEEV